VDVKGNELGVVLLQIKVGYVKVLNEVLMGIFDYDYFFRLNEGEVAPEQFEKEY